MLSHTRLMPNRALRNLISQWCTAQGISYDPPDGYHLSAEISAAASSYRAASFANQKTAEILLGKLTIGSESEKTVAALEICLLAKTGLGAIPLLQKLLNSPNSGTQENSVTAILNLSILKKNKMRIMELNGCLSLIVAVLINGLTTKARENADAMLFSLSTVHAYKKRIIDECSAVEALALLLKEGTPRGKKDDVTALFNLSTHPNCSARMVESGAVSALNASVSELIYANLSVHRCDRCKSWGHHKNICKNSISQSSSEMSAVNIALYVSELTYANLGV